MHAQAPHFARHSVGGLSPTDGIFISNSPPHFRVFAPTLPYPPRGRGLGFAPEGQHDCVVLKII
jgi:hypothetical protein